MATLDWQVAAAGETTLVELFVTSDTEIRVEIASNLEPVWPPRRQNRPVAGWDGSGFEGVVSAGEPLVLGYASPDDPVEPPATIVDTEPVTGSSEGAPTPEALVRELGEAGPPRDAVPAHGSPSTDRDTGADSRSPGHGPTTDEQRPAGHESTVGSGQSSARGSASAHPHETGHSRRDDDTHPAEGSETARAQTPGSEARARDTESADTSGARRSQRSGGAGTGNRRGAESGSSAGRTRQSGDTGTGSRQQTGESGSGSADSTQPRRTERARTDEPTAGTATGQRGRTDTDGPGEAIDAWLDALGGRIETAERLAAVETAGEARSAVDAAGGIEQVRALCEQLDADRRRLERIGQRHGGFGDRLDEIDVPLSALERLA
jgi:hypothetical protein